MNLAFRSADARESLQYIREFIAATTVLRFAKKYCSCKKSQMSQLFKPWLAVLMMSISRFRDMHRTSIYCRTLQRPQIPSRSFFNNSTGIVCALRHLVCIKQLLEIKSTIERMDNSSDVWSLQWLLDNLDQCSFKEPDRKGERKACI